MATAVLRIVGVRIAPGMVTAARRLAPGAGPGPQGRASAAVASAAMAEEEQFGPNAWLVDEMYEQYRADPQSVSESWQEFFADYHTPLHPNPHAVASADGDEGSAAVATAARRAGHRRARTGVHAQPRLRRRPPAPPRRQGAGRRSRRAAGGRRQPHPRGHAMIVANMERSLAVPTATSFRNVPAKLLEVNRRVINGYLGRKGERQGQLHPPHRLRRRAGHRRRRCRR